MKFARLWLASSLLVLAASASAQNTFPAIGNVGIGTTSPAYPLDVHGPIASQGVSLAQAGSIALTTDGTYQIAGSGAINGIYTIDWGGPNRAEHYQISVNTHQFDSAGVEVITSSSYGGQTVLSNFRVVGSADGSARYFLVDVANRNGGTGNMSVTAVGPNAWLALSATPGGSSPIYNSLLTLGGRSGQFGIGTLTPGATLEVNGSVKLTSNSGASLTFADSTVQSTAWNGVLSGGDYAESVNVSGRREEYEPGDVLVIGCGNSTDVAKSSQPYSTLVSGIYSTKPGVVGRRRLTGDKNEEIPMAMVGVVPTKVSAENGPIKRGDLLVTSATEGYAMKGTDSSRMLGAIVGKAMGSLDSGTGVIEVLVSLQ
jgi:hypothetical protein